MQISRRSFSKGAVLAGSSALLGCVKQIPPAGPIPPPPYPGLPEPAASGIEHIVIITMENRSFDHLLGWLPGADGQQAGLSFTDRSGTAHPTYQLSGDDTGCGHLDPDHSFADLRTAYDGGKMDGFLRAGKNDSFSIGYYEEKDIPFYAALARNYTTCDRYFASILGPTFPNRMFIYTGQTDRLTDSINLSSLPTIFDRLAAAKISNAYYFSNVPFLALWGVKYLGISKLHDEFLEQAAKGTLPAVSFVDPRYTVLDDGTGNDDHPHADIREGDLFLHDIFEAISTGPKWAKTVVVIQFDECGGFYERIPPPRATAANAIDTDIVNGKTLLGFRVPTVIASPFSRGTPANPRISSMVFDHTSALKLIEWRFGLAPLTPRDGSSDIQNLAYALDFSNPQTAVPTLPKPTVPSFVPPCLENLLGFTAATEAATPKTATPAPPVGGRKTEDAEDMAFTRMKKDAKKYGFKAMKKPLSPAG